VPRNNVHIGRAIIALALVIGLAYGLHQLLSGPTWGEQSIEDILSWQRVRDVRVEAIVEPDAGTLAAEATLRLEWQGPGNGRLYFLLNPGLNVSEVLLGDTPLSHVRRQDGIFVQLEQAPSEFDLRIRYEGTVSPATAHPAHLAADIAMLPAWSWWYPLDPHSAHTFYGDLSFPATFEVIGVGVLDAHRVTEGRRRVAWRESRPVFGASVAAGVFEKATRWQEKLWTSVYWPRDLDVDAATVLDAVGASHGYFRARFGEDAFGTINVVVAPGVPFAHHGGNSTLFLPWPAPDHEPQALTIARLMARNWWGGTVTARWHTRRAEAGAWLVEGLAENSAYRAFRNARGLEALTRHLESLPPLTASGPTLRTMNLERFWSLDNEERTAFTRMSGAVVRLLDTRLGPEAFEGACRQLLRTHQHATLSSAALQHELEQTSGASLDTFFGQWFDEPAALDYGIQEVTESVGQVRIQVLNQGDIPLDARVDLAVITDTAFEMHTFQAPAFATEVTLPVRGAFQSALLDPHVRTPDRNRRNNLYPPRHFPASFRVTPSGIALLLDDNPWHPAQHGLLKLDDQFEPVAAHGPGQPGRDVSFPATTEGELAAGWRWSNGALVGPEGHRLLLHEEAVPAPLPDSARLRADGLFAWLTAEDQVIGFLPDRSDHTLEVLADGVSAFAWDPEASSWLVLFTVDGSLLRKEAGTGRETRILDRERPVVKAQMSEDAAKVAWLEPTGLLRLADTETPIPFYAAVRGEVLDFQWSAESDILFVLTREPHPELASPLVATYRLSALRPDGTRDRDRNLAPLLTQAAEPPVRSVPVRSTPLGQD